MLTEMQERQRYWSDLESWVSNAFSPWPAIITLFSIALLCVGTYIYAYTEAEKRNEEQAIIDIQKRHELKEIMDKQSAASKKVKSLQAQADRIEARIIHKIKRKSKT